MYAASNSLTVMEVAPLYFTVKHLLKCIELSRLEFHNAYMRTIRIDLLLFFDGNCGGILVGIRGLALVLGPYLSSSS